MSWIILILISATFLSLRTIITKKVLIKNNTLPVLFLVSLFSLLFMLFFINKISFDFSAYVYLLLFLKSFVITIAWYCIYQAYKNLDISTVSPLRNLSPIFLIILSAIFLNESITLINYLGVLILMISAYMLELKKASDFFTPLKMIKNKFFIYIIISLVGTSISAILDKVLIGYINYYSLMFVFYLFLTIFYFLILFFRKELKSIKSLFGYKHIFLILAITFSALFADLSYFAAVAIPGTMIVLLIPLRRTSTFISTIFGGRIFHEENILYKATVCLFMIFGIFLLVS